MVPIPVCFYLFGSKLRAKSKFNPAMMLKPPPLDDSTEEEGDAVSAPPQRDGRTVEKAGNNE
jgi:hypothetical protein